MGERTVNWLIYTCLIGLTPVLARLFIWSLSSSGVDPLATGDLVAFGLVLHTSNLNEVNSSAIRDPRWKTLLSGVAAIFIVFYGLILLTTIAPIPNINYSGIRTWTIVMCVVSFIFSFSLFFERHVAVKHISNSEAK